VKPRSDEFENVLREIMDASIFKAAETLAMNIDDALMRPTLLHIRSRLPPAKEERKTPQQVRVSAPHCEIQISNP
jgi:hypothetical protein